MKKFKLLFVFAVIVATMGLFSCKDKNGISNSTFGSDNDLLAFYSLTSANILSNGGNQQKNMRSKNNMMPLSVTTDTLDMETVNGYLQMMESMFSESAPVVMTNGESDRIEYANKVLFEATDLAGKKSTYVIYYSQTELVDDDDDDDFEDRFDNEKEYRLEGLAVIEGVEYQITGEKELENDEYSLDIVVKLDNNNYVIIEQELENNEQEYEYEVFKNGKRYTSISFEVERGTEFEAEFITNEKGYTEKYRFYKENNQVRIRYQSNAKSFTIVATAKVDSNTNETIYDYKIIETNEEFHFKN